MQVTQLTQSLKSELSKEQQKAYLKYVQGKNIFITGPAGTGKSHLIKYIYNNAIIRNKNIQVCALTGTASLLLKECKARTVHSFAGIGLGTGTIETLVLKIKNSWFFSKVWREVSILVVDEVSMLSKKLFELLDIIVKQIRKNPRPFGGIQLIFLGDFYQLPPIESNNEPDTGMFCFESDIWFSTFLVENHIILKTIFRQTDEVYIRILNEIRIEKITQESIDILKGLVGKKIENDKIVTNIFPKKRMVEKINFQEMDKLDVDEEFEYELKIVNCVKNTKITPLQITIEINSIKNSLLCEESLTLRKGCHVMCIVNFADSPLCNGSQGIVTGFSKFNFPIVKFNNGIETEIGFHKWESETIVGLAVCQIPLILAWAISIHKIQGCSLDEAIIDVGSDIFEFAQTYVALSRVKSIKGLYLSAFDETRIKVNPKVIDFYNIVDNVLEDF